MSSGIGEVLVDDRREEEGDRYGRRLANERSVSLGGVGDRERRETSESDASEGMGLLKGELGPLSRQNDMVMGRI
jgi:hypothetical protein